MPYMFIDRDLYFYIYVLTLIILQEHKDVLENALHVALKGGRTEFVQLLLDRDYGADVSLKSYLTINRLRDLHRENVSKSICFTWTTKNFCDLVRFSIISILIHEECVKCISLEGWATWCLINRFLVELINLARLFRALLHAFLRA